MAGISSVSCNALQFIAILVYVHFSTASSMEFEVGDTSGWVVPDANNSNFYNIWASNNRFIVGDTITFEYEKDSVMMVDERDYRKCNAHHPALFSNTGKVTVELDHPGPFYFISGATGHCERGQKMIIKVLSFNSSDSNTSAAALEAYDNGIFFLLLSFLVSVLKF